MVLKKSECVLSKNQMGMHHIVTIFENGFRHTMILMMVSMTRGHQGVCTVHGCTALPLVDTLGEYNRVGCCRISFRSSTVQSGFLMKMLM
jgi:Na+-transporting NADH:ubiquinone oxidoreductase subunit NqrD